MSGYVAKIKELIKSNSLSIRSNLSKQAQMRELMKKTCSPDHVSNLSSLVSKNIKDFDYLLHPQRLPGAYEACCKETIRRKKFI